MNYELIWSDEFSGISLNLDKWSIETGGHGFGNAEKQYYTDQEKNVRIENNQLVIEAHKENYHQMGYTSAKLTTYGKFDLQYGKVVIKAQIPSGKGTWPAIWMLPNAIKSGASWPECGEIDIMEHVGRDEDKIHFSLHTGLYNHNKNTQYTYFEKFNKITEDFYEYTMIWDEKHIAFYVNDKMVATFNKGEFDREISHEGWPFDEPYYLILNLAIGGYWGGDIDDQIFPVKFLIDSVKIYKRK